MTLLDTADVPDAFTAAATSYDRMVALNPGYHRHLRTAADGLTETLRLVSTAAAPVRASTSTSPRRRRASTSSPRRCSSSP